MSARRHELKWPGATCGAALVCALVLAGCGGAAPSVKLAGTAARAAVRPAPCPDTGRTTEQRERELLQQRSTRVASGRLAPAGVRWTTVCGIQTHVFRGARLDHVLNSSRPYAGQPCESDFIGPELVILRYATSERQFVVEMDGCPGVVLNDGARLVFGTPALLPVTRILWDPRPIVG